MNAVSTPALAQHRGWFTPDWANWRLALVVALIVIPVAVLALPLDVAFWVSLARSPWSRSPP